MSIFLVLLRFRSSHSSVRRTDANFGIGALVTGLAGRIMRMVLIGLSAAARHAGVTGALLLQRMRSARLRFLRVLAVLVTGARTADAGRVRVFVGHVTGPADSPDWWCSARYFPAGPVPAGCPARPCGGTCRGGPRPSRRGLSGCGWQAELWALSPS